MAISYEHANPWQKKNLQKDVVSCTAPFVSLNTIANRTPTANLIHLKYYLWAPPAKWWMNPPNVPGHSEITALKIRAYWPLDFSSPAINPSSQVAFHLQIIKVQGALFLRDLHTFVRFVLVRVVHVVVLSLQEAIASMYGIPTCTIQINQR